MKRNFSSLQFNSFFSSIASFMALASIVVLITSLSSCDNLSKGRYKFQPESMYWLQFRGPNSSGIAPEGANPPIHFSADTNLLWKTEIPSGWSSPCIVNERILLTGFDSKDSILSTFCLHRKDGKLLWSQPLVGVKKFEQGHPIHNPANGTICSDGMQIYSFFASYGILCYDLEGKLNWALPIDSLTYTWGSGSSPIIYGGNVILDLENNYQPRLLAIDKHFGHVSWVQPDTFTTRFATGSTTTWSTPVIWKDQIILHHKSTIAGYSPENGERIWWIAFRSGGEATPVVAEEGIYLSTWHNFGEIDLYVEYPEYQKLLSDHDQNKNGMLDRMEISEDLILFTRPEGSDIPLTVWTILYYFDGIDEDRDDMISRKEWEDFIAFRNQRISEHGMMVIIPEGTGELPLSAIRWKVNENSPEMPSPLLLQDYVFFIKNGGIVTLIDRNTGKVILSERLGAPGSYLASPLQAGNKIYTCSYNGTVTVLSAEDFSILAQNKLSEKIAASPVAVDDVLYIRTDEHLYAFRDK